MNDTEKAKSPIEKVSETLLNFAVTREDVKWLAANLPKETVINRAKVEYELQILKIISVGWSISYYLENSPQKNQLTALFWQAVFEFAQSLSETTELMIGQDIDYFQVLRERLDMYLAAMAEQPDAPEPAVVIGPQFAQTCGDADDAFVVMTGSRLFIATVGGVKAYLEEIKLR